MRRVVDINANFSTARVQLTSPLFFGYVLSFSPSPFLPSDHPTFFWLRIFTILRVEKFAFFQPMSQRDCALNARHFLLFFSSQILIKIKRHFYEIAINIQIKFSLQELVILIYKKKICFSYNKYL